MSDDHTFAVRESEGKLYHYANMYGQQIYSMAPEQARQKAAELQTHANETTSTVQRLHLLAKAVHYETIAQCLSTIQTEQP